jgi:HAMP domain-containing protein
MAHPRRSKRKVVLVGLLAIAGILAVLTAGRSARVEETAPSRTEISAEEPRAEKDQAIDELLETYQRLAAGDSEVLDALNDASAALPLPAQRAIETARAAIESEDLLAARYWISIAIADSGESEPGR